MTATVLVIDGPRSAGKTTMVNRICEHFKDNDRLKVYIHKTSRPSSNLWDGINSILTDWYYLPHDHVILVDRFHLTEYVYSTINARVDDYELWSNFSKFDQRLLSFGLRFRYTVLMATKDELLARTLERPELDKRVYDMDPDIVWDVWTMAVAKSKIATMRVNRDRLDADVCFASMVKWIETNGGKR